MLHNVFGLYIFVNNYGRMQNIRILLVRDGIVDRRILIYDFFHGGLNICIIHFDAMDGWGL